MTDMKMSDYIYHSGKEEKTIMEKTSEKKTSSYCNLDIRSGANKELLRNRNAHYSCRWDAEADRKYNC